MKTDKELLTIIEKHTDIKKDLWQKTDKDIFRSPLMPKETAERERDNIIRGILHNIKKVSTYSENYKGQLFTSEDLEKMDKEFRTAILVIKSDEAAKEPGHFTKKSLHSDPAKPLTTAEKLHYHTEKDTHQVSLDLNKFGKIYQKFDEGFNPPEQKSAVKP